MKFNSWCWDGKTTKEKATNYANSLFKLGYSLQYIDAQLCCINNLGVNNVKQIMANFTR